MKITFILPCVGRRNSEPYPRSWLMEPLAIAQLSALTPTACDKVFYDDRLESIPYEESTDLVAISVETYTARRAYQISEEYRKRGVKVVMGGFHPTLAPEDAALHADAIVIGEAENLWSQVLEDFRAGQLCPRYVAKERPDLVGILPDRSILSGKRYVNLALVETGRGCRMSCDFCSIASFFNQSYRARPIPDVVAEIRSLRRRPIFFVDDNLAVDRNRSLALFEALQPLRIQWVGQISVHAAGDDELLQSMRRSGCMGVLVGFESVTTGSKALAGKGLRGDLKAIYEKAMIQFARYGLGVYGTFVFGYDDDSRQSIRNAADFAMQQRLFFAAFNHLVPFPGTPLYERLCQEGRMREEQWWLASTYRFGDLAFRPARLSAEALAEACYQARRSFYSWPNIIKRSMNRKNNCRDLFMTWVFLSANLSSRREVDLRQGLPLGVEA